MKEIIDSFQKEVFGNLDIDGFLKDLEERKVELTDIITLDEESDTVDFIKNELNIDLDFDVLYPEGKKEKIVIEGSSIKLNNYKYLVEFFQIDKDNEEYVWYSAYENLENLKKEIRIIDIFATV